MRAAENLLGPSDLSASPTFNGYSSSSHLVDVADRVIREFADDQDHFPYYNDDNENDTVFFSSVPPSPRNTTLCRYYLAEDDGNNINQQPQDSHQKQTSETGPEETDQTEDEDDDSDFEFAPPLTQDTSSPIAADEIFHNGQIRPLFPLFNTDLIFTDTDWRLPYTTTTTNQSSQSSSTPNATNSSTPPTRVPLKNLLIVERETDPSSSSSEADDLERLAPDTYCVWTPNQHRLPELNKKSNSTGSSSKRWRLRRLLNRTHSDGSRDSLMFLPSHQTKDEKVQNKKDQEQSKDQKQCRHSNKLVRILLPPVGTAKIYEGNNKSKGKGKEGTEVGGGYGEINRSVRDHQNTTDRRKKMSYLPYRQDLAGFFANASGVTRTIHPF